MKRDRSKICKIISQMLDNPNESGIYPTTTAYTRLELYVIQERIQCLGWMYAFACTALDAGEDLRDMEVPNLLEAMHRDLDMGENQNE